MIIGIDPGKRGGVAMSDGTKVVAKSTPEEPTGMANIIRSHLNTSYIEEEELIAYIENVHAFPTDTRSSAFKFGMNYGIWIGILATLGIKTVKVSPFKWMEKWKPLPKIKKERKNELKMIAKDFYPKATLSTSDAILIAVYGMNNESGE